MTKPRRGRPPKVPPSVNMHIKMTAGELDELREAAGRESLPVSTWVRVTALRVARGVRIDDDERTLRRER